MKCARSFIPHSYSGMDRTPFHPFCSQEQNEQNIANAFCTKHSHCRIVNKKRALSFVHAHAPHPIMAGNGGARVQVNPELGWKRTLCTHEHNSQKMAGKGVHVHHNMKIAAIRSACARDCITARQLGCICKTLGITQRGVH